jgi:hypothetical protein
MKKRLESALEEVENNPPNLEHPAYLKSKIF